MRSNTCDIVGISEIGCNCLHNPYRPLKQWFNLAIFSASGKIFVNHDCMIDKYNYSYGLHIYFSDHT